MTPWHFLLFAIALPFATSGADLSTNTLSGRRVKLTDALLFIPENVSTISNKIDFTLHLHGAPGTVEAQFVKARMPGVLANVTLPGLSAVYAEKFKDTNVFPRILAEAASQLNSLGISNTSQIARVTVTSFSAGFGGVRELLKSGPIFDRIDALVMADSIYAGFIGEETNRLVNPLNMEGFLRFARAAVGNRKQMIVSHSQLHTPAYASTVETADYLLKELAGARELVSTEWADGWTLISTFKKGRFEVLSFTGETGEDHMRHLRNLGLFLGRLKQ